MVQVHSHGADVFRRLIPCTSKLRGELITIVFVGELLDHPSLRREVITRKYLEKRSDVNVSATFRPYPSLDLLRRAVSIENTQTLPGEASSMVANSLSDDGGVTADVYDAQSPSIGIRHRLFD